MSEDHKMPDPDVIRICVRCADGEDLADLIQEVYTRGRLAGRAAVVAELEGMNALALAKMEDPRPVSTAELLGECFHGRTLVDTDDQIREVCLDCGARRFAGAENWTP